MQLYVISRKNKKCFWVSQYLRLTTIYQYALKTNDIKEIVRLIKKYIMDYKVLVLTEEGEVISKHE